MEGFRKALAGADSQIATRPARRPRRKQGPTPRLNFREEYPSLAGKYKGLARYEGRSRAVACTATSRRSAEALFRSNRRTDSPTRSCIPRWPMPGGGRSFPRSGAKRRRSPLWPRGAASLADKPVFKAGLNNRFASRKPARDAHGEPSPFRADRGKRPTTSGIARGQRKDLVGDRFRDSTERGLSALRLPGGSACNCRGPSPS